MRDLSTLFFNITFFRALGVVIQSIVMLHLAKSLEVEEFGIYAISYATLGLARYLGPLGSDQVVLRRISGFYKGTISESAQAEIDASLFISAIGSVIIIFIILFMHKMIGFLEILTIKEFFFLTLSVPAFVLQGAFISHIRSLGHNIKAQVPEALGMHVLMAIFISIVSETGLLNQTSVLICLFMAGWVVCFSYIFLRKRVGIRRLIAPNRIAIFDVLQECNSVFSASLFIALGARAPVFLALYFSGPVGAAVIEVALRFGSVSNLITTGSGAILSPLFARLSAEKNNKLLYSLLLKGSFLTAIPALIYFLIILFASYYVVENFLPREYIQAITPMLLIALATFINAAAGLSNTLLMMSGKARIVAYLSLAQLLTLIVTSAILGPAIGIVAISAGILAGYLIRDGSAFLYNYYVFKFRAS